jgi:hypothetical protein
MVEERMEIRVCRMKGSEETPIYMYCINRK